MKVTIPVILAVTLLIAITLAFMPVERSGTIHTGIQGSLIIKDVFVNIGSAASTNNDAITIDFLVTKHDGSTVAGLTQSSFSTSFIAGTTNPGTVTITVANSGSGAYRLTIDPTNNWVAGRTDIVLTATSGSFTGSTLVVAAIP